MARPRHLIFLLANTVSHRDINSVVKFKSSNVSAVNHYEDCLIVR